MNCRLLLTLLLATGSLGLLQHVVHTFHDLSQHLDGDVLMLYISLLCWICVPAVFDFILQ
jgi:hypothetical protein